MTADLGKQATTPSGIPLRGWWQVAQRVFGQLSRDHVTVVAAGVAFFGFLSIFPAIAAFVILYGLIADPATVTDQLAPIRDLVPDQVYELLATQLREVSGTTSRTLGFGLLFSLGFAIWSSAKGSGALLMAMDIAYNQPHRDGWIWPRVAALLFTLAGLLFAVVAIGLLAAVPATVALLGIDDTIARLLLALRWILLAGAVLLALAALYRYGPNRRNARAEWITAGSVLATVIWVAASWGFARYVSNFGSYNEMFGTLGTVVVLLLWLYISAFIICLGAELNAELELHTDADTTVGHWRPKGERDAFVADHTTPLEPDAEGD